MSIAEVMKVEEALKYGEILFRVQYGTSVL